MALFDAIRRGLIEYERRTFDGAAEGLDRQAEAVTRRMRATTAHGDQTGATRTSYNARRVGRGETGAGVVQSLRAVVNLLNAGHAANGRVTITGPLGVIVDSQTDYQSKLETERAGARAVIGPTIQAEAQGFTRAAAEGARRKL